MPAVSHASCRTALSGCRARPGAGRSTVDGPGAQIGGVACAPPTAVLLGAALLAVYVGLEFGVGNWAHGYRVEARAAPDLFARFAVSGYWLGLTLGRFLISPAATRLTPTQVGLTLTYTCLIGVATATGLTWWAPSFAIAVTGLALLGFFLGPIFPTTMAVTPRVTEPRLVPTAMGVMNAGSVISGSALPWLGGALAERIAAWTLLPMTLALALLQLLIWSRLARRVRNPDQTYAPA
jgi:fucose permease